MTRRVPSRLGIAPGMAIAVLAAPVVARAQDAPATVRVDVVVTARSGAVPALPGSAFTVTVGGEPREVVSAEPTVAPNTGRTFYVAIDENSVFKGGEASLRTVASGLADRLAPGDRLGVVLLPSSKPALAPTDDAAAIERALATVTGRRPNDFANFGMGIGEALAIAESDSFALTAVADKECHAPPPAPVRESVVVPASQGPGDPRRLCVQTIAKNVEVLIARVRTVGAESYRALLDFSAGLRETPGPKTVVVVTAGLGVPLDAGIFDELAIRAGLSEVAVPSILVEPVASPSTRRLVPASVVSERRSLMRRLNELSGAALGTAYSALGGSIEEPLDRLMAGATPYRLEVRPKPTDREGTAARLAVTVRGNGLSARGRPYLVPPKTRPAAAATPEARLGKALGGTAPTGDVLPMDAGGYLAGVPGPTATLLISGEVPIEPTPDGAPAITIGYLLLDTKKQPVVKGPVPPVEPPAAAPGTPPPARTRIGFAGSVDGLAPDTYILRVAATDGAGRVGLVEREVVLRGTPIGDATAGDLLVGRIESNRTVALAPGALATGDTLFLQWDLTGVRGAAPAATLAIVDRASGKPVMPLSADVDTSRPGLARVTALVKPGLLPAGDFEAVGEVAAAGKSLGQRRHAFVVRGTGGGPATATASLASVVGDLSALAPRFTRDAVLAPGVLADAYAALDRQAKSEPGKAALARARAGDRSGGASLTGAEPVIAAFLRGLGDLEGANLTAVDAPTRALARADLERAAQGFRDALRADPDFLPAAIYLGACYALGGRDQEAAGAWQTALIALDSKPDVFRLTVDARLRAGDWSGADELLAEAEQKFPGDRSLTARRVIVELAVGRVDHGLALLDGLDEPSADLLFAAMRILHGAHAAGIAVEDPTRDRQRFARYLTAYTARNGADRALAERWLEAMK